MNNHDRIELEELRGALEMIEDEIYTTRRQLWLGHGHSQIYGDDGDMQCGQCGMDYKRARLDDVALMVCTVFAKKLADLGE